MSKRSTKATTRDTHRDWREWATRKAPHLAIALVLIGTVRIASTYSVFYHTVDEGLHIACGLEWITRGSYKIEAQHPPLARVMAAAGPWLAGAKLLDGDHPIVPQALGALYGGENANYEQRLLWSRIGVLPSFWVCAWVLWAACIRWFDRLTALAAIFAFTSLPAVLAHSGLATTDMTFTAAFCAALLAGLILIEEPSIGRGALFGVALAVALLAKFSTIAFFPCAVLAALGAVRPRREELLDRARRIALPVAAGLLVCALIVWAGYRFSVGYSPLLGTTVPVPEFFNGIEEVRKHNAQGHDSYILGQYSESGFWYYYPVALLFKSPFAFLVLAVAGGYFCLRGGEARYLVPVAFLTGIFLFATTSRINIGVRHVMPVYIFLSILAGVAVTHWWRKSAGLWARGVVAGLLLWLAGTSAASHPDYLAYFNFLAGDRPEEILVDSDLDWGQDMKRLGERLRQLGARQVALNPTLYGFWQEYHGFPAIVPLSARVPRPGWNAVSLTLLKYVRPKKDLVWTDTMRPAERVGKGILLYFQR